MLWVGSSRSFRRILVGLVVAILVAVAISIVAPDVFYQCQCGTWWLGGCCPCWLCNVEVGP